MRPRERREGGEQDLFRSRLDQIIDMTHALVKLARTIDWHFLEEKLGAVYTDKPGQRAALDLTVSNVVHPPTVHRQHLRRNPT
jgi:hypothetical protein